MQAHSDISPLLLYNPLFSINAWVSSFIAKTVKTTTPVRLLYIVPGECISQPGSSTSSWGTAQGRREGGWDYSWGISQSLSTASVCPNHTEVVPVPYYLHNSSCTHNCSGTLARQEQRLMKPCLHCQPEIPGWSTRQRTLCDVGSSIRSMNNSHWQLVPFNEGIWRVQLWAELDIMNRYTCYIKIN